MVSTEIPVKITKTDGFTLIELLIVVAIIGIIAAIAAVRAVNSAQATYAASCGGGGFATTLADLGKAPVNGVPFISPDLSATDPAIKSGYTISVADGLGAIDVLSAANTCNASAANSRSAFYVHAEPVQVG